MGEAEVESQIKADVKAKLEDGLDPGKSAGNRSAIQVSLALLIRARRVVLISWDRFSLIVCLPCSRH